jgi:hypothetical protein
LLSDKADCQLPIADLFQLKAAQYQREIPESIWARHNWHSAIGNRQLAIGNGLSVHP